MPSHGNTIQARVIALLFALRLTGSASWRCSVNIEGDPSQVLVYTAASMRCFSDATGEQNLTVYADASLLSYPSSFTGETLSAAGTFGFANGTLKQLTECYTQD